MLFFRLRNIYIIQQNIFIESGENLSHLHNPTLNQRKCISSFLIEHYHKA